MKLFFVVSLFSASITLNPAIILAKEWTCTKFKTSPFLIDGCQGEGCPSVSNKIIKDIVLYSKPDLNSKQVARLKKGYVVQKIEHKTLVKRMGKFIVGKSKESESNWALTELKKYGVNLGDTIYGIQYGGEGLYEHCIGDNIFYLTNAYGLEQSTEPKDQLDADDWSYVKSKKGSGWAPTGDWYECQGC